MRASIDPLAVLQGLGFAGPAAPCIPVAGGLGGTLLWRAALRDSGDVLLRVFPDGRVALAQREHAAHDAARAGAVPAPEILASGAVDGHAALVMRWMPGEPIASLQRGRPEYAMALGTAAGRTLAALHRIPFPGDGSRNWIAWSGDYAEQLRPLLEGAIASTGMPGDRLLHLDFHPENLLTDGTSITAVIDWANVRSGPPLADLARSRAILAMARDHAPIPPAIRSVVETFDRWLVEGYVAESGAPLPACFDLFETWAAAVEIGNLAPKVGQPGSWVTNDVIEALRDDCRQRMRALEASGPAHADGT